MKVIYTFLLTTQYFNNLFNTQKSQKIHLKIKTNKNSNYKIEYTELKLLGSNYRISLWKIFIVSFLLYESIYIFNYSKSNTGHGNI